ncbi:MAG: thioredoxin domain-containing protein [Patescibacteria group bacterium]
MKKPSLFLATFLFLAACVSKEGLSAESSKTPTGNPNSSIVVIEYGDLQCPACKGAETTIVKPLLEKYGNVIRYEFRHFPLRQIHAFAQEAAEAAECAADQGKFWEFVRNTYENQEKLSRKDLLARAETVGVADTGLFARCMKSRIKRDAVQKEYEEGLERGVNSTPTFFVNDTKVERNTIDAISAAIEERVGAQKL